MSHTDNLARARAEKRELEWVRRRLAETREDRKQLAAHLEAAERARDYEQADVDALTQGLGGFFRRLMADHTDLTREQQELQAAQLVCDELTDELRAIDAELAHLTEREQVVADAEAHYTQALADVEAEARARGELNEELDTLIAIESELTAGRREVHEAMSLGIGVQRAFLAIVNLVRELEPRDKEEPILVEGLVRVMSGWTREKYHALCGALANAQQGLRRFEQVCRTLPPALPAGIDLDLRLEPLPEAGTFVLRDLLWTNGRRLEAILPEVSRVSSSLSSVVGELKSRDVVLAQALAECTRVRAHLLDPDLAQA